MMMIDDDDDDEGDAVDDDDDDDDDGGGDIEDAYDDEALACTTGIALSGGGMRSATLSVGWLQVFHELGQSNLGSSSD